MNQFQSQLISRSPLAGAMVETVDFVLHDSLIDSIWQQHRGRCYDDVLRFPIFLRLLRDALVDRGGSAHQLFLELEQQDKQPCDESNFYRKLSRMPVQISRALLRECTHQRLLPLMPVSQQTQLPACFDGFTVVVGDGKQIKNVVKRLKLTRGYTGQLIGAKALVGIDLRSGLVLAMSDSLDGMTNDVPLVPELLQQLHQTIPGPILSVWDRQFYDLRTISRLIERQGDGVVVRTRKICFEVQTSVEYRDAQGRLIIDEIGTMKRGKGSSYARRSGRGRAAMQLRRVTLVRGNGLEDVMVITNLLDQTQYRGQDLLELYRHRWTIETIFQQVTQTFGLSKLIGSSPRAVLLQFAYCLLLYNLIQVIKAYLADDGKVLMAMVSGYYVFNDIKRELTAVVLHTDLAQWPRHHRTVDQMRLRLSQLLKGRYSPIRYKKNIDKNPRKPKPPPQRLHGGHSSVQRILEGRIRLAM